MNQNKLSFESENLVVDYISFNSKGFFQEEYLQKIASYLCESFGFNATFKREELDQKETFFFKSRNIRTGRVKCVDKFEVIINILRKALSLILAIQIGYRLV
jgi:predicted AAA+ superfamily ATPase